MQETRDAGSTPGLGRAPGERNGNPLLCSWLENPMDRGAWWAIVHGALKRQARLNTQAVVAGQYYVIYGSTV